MALKKIFSILLFISLASNVFLVYQWYQITEGLKAQLEMIDTINSELGELNTNQDKVTTSKIIYKEYPKNNLQEISNQIELDKIKRKQSDIELGINSVHNQFELYKLQTRDISSPLDNVGESLGITPYWEEKPAIMH